MTKSVEKAANMVWSGWHAGWGIEDVTVFVYTYRPNVNFQKQAIERETFRKIKHFAFGIAIKRCFTRLIYDTQQTLSALAPSVGVSRIRLEL